MGTQKKSIDEIWRELNAKSAPRSVNLAGIPSLPGITSSVRVVPKPKPQLPTENGVEDVPIGSQDHKKHMPQYDPTKAGVTVEDVQAYMGTMQRLVNCLSDPDRSTRRQAAVNLQTKLMQGDASTPKASPQMLQALVCGPLLYPLVNMMKDVVEKCR